MPHPHYCVQCAAPLVRKHIAIENTERYACSHCGRIHYENPLPTAGALIVSDGKILLVRRAVDPFRGMWDIPGGFLEKHEHPEAGLRREIREELGVEIDIREMVGIFMGTYTDRDVSTLNMYYQVTIREGVPAPRSDVDAVEWFSLQSLPEIAFPQNLQAIAALSKLRD